MRTTLSLVAVLLFAVTLRAEPEAVTIRVAGWFTMQNGFGSTAYRENIVMPVIPGSTVGPDRQYSITCPKMVDNGVYQSTYDKQKAEFRIQATDLKGKAQTVKCEMFSHSWRQPVR